METGHAGGWTCKWSLVGKLVEKSLYSLQGGERGAREGFTGLENYR